MRNYKYQPAMQVARTFLSSKILIGFLTGIGLTTLVAFHVLDSKPACAIALDKNNVFYIGLDNPVSIVVRGVPDEQVKIEAKGISLIHNSGDHYTVRASEPGDARIFVSGPGMERLEFRYRVKRIPDPVVLLGARHGSRTIGNGEFKAQNGLVMVLENFDFDVRCEVLGYELTYLASRLEPITVSNQGGRYNPAARELVNKARPGDVYFFSDIKCKCPGDATGRLMGDLVFRIK